MKDPRPEDAVGRERHVSVLAALAEEPKDLLRPQGQDDILAHAGLLVVEFLAVQVDRLRGGTDFDDQFRRTVQVLVIIYMDLPAVFWKYEEAAVRLGFAIRSQDLGVIEQRVSSGRRVRVLAQPLRHDLLCLAVRYLLR